MSKSYTRIENSVKGKQQCVEYIPGDTFNKLRKFTLRLQSGLQMPLSPLQALWFIFNRMPKKIDVPEQRIPSLVEVKIYLSPALFDLILSKIKHNFAPIAKVSTTITAAIEIS